MASRKETGLRRQSLLDELRQACLDGSLPLGAPLPPVRELVTRYNVSHRIVNEALQKLTEEGLLYAVPRKGTFVGQPHQTREGLYLLVTDRDPLGNDQLSRLQVGFEEQISLLGGTCLTLTLDALTAVQEAAHRDASAALAPAGVFYSGITWSAKTEKFGPACARVYFSEQNTAAAKSPVADDTVDDILFFDNEGGGYQVTHYLLQQGHDRITFLGLHGQFEETGLFEWSRERARGWQRALHEAGSHAQELLVLPDSMSTGTSAIAFQESVAFENSQRLIEKFREGAVSAVVTVNVHAGHGLMRALQQSSLPPELWPVITTFGIGDAKVSMMTSMLLPWEQMGRKAADLLWSRNKGERPQVGQGVSVPMRLITRLTCRPAWKMRPEAAILTNYSENYATAA